MRMRSIPAWGWPLVAVGAIAVVIARRPDAVTNAQFWAEDGTIWFATAYDHGGFASLFVPYNGYLQTFSRLVAALSPPSGCAGRRSLQHRSDRRAGGAGPLHPLLASG
jgi:hypothetical protein